MLINIIIQCQLSIRPCNHFSIMARKVVCVLSYYALLDIVTNINVDANLPEVQSLVEKLREMVLSVLDDVPKRPKDGSAYHVDGTSVIDIMEE